MLERYWTMSVTLGGGMLEKYWMVKLLPEVGACWRGTG